VHIFVVFFLAACAYTDSATNLQCDMQLEEALQIVRLSNPWGRDIDDPRRRLSATYFSGVPEGRISGWGDSDGATYVSKMVDVLKGKQIWLVDAPLIPARGVRGRNLQFFVDACDRKMLEATSK
jgi:hypothetical protein